MGSLASLGKTIVLRLNIQARHIQPMHAGICFYNVKTVEEAHGSLSEDLRTWHKYGDHPYFECRIHIFTIKRQVPVQDNWRHGAINLLLIHLFVPLLMQHGGKYDINVQ